MCDLRLDVRCAVFSPIINLQENYNALILLVSFFLWYHMDIDMVYAYQETRKERTMTNADKKKAYDLAIAYGAYVRTIKEGSNDERAMWAEMLLDAQEASGVEIVKANHLRTTVKVFS